MKKKCRDCKKFLSISLFYIKKDIKDGHSSYCKNCHYLRNKEAIKKWRNTEHGKLSIRENNKRRTLLHWQRMKEDFEYAMSYRKKTNTYARMYMKTDKGILMRRRIDSQRRLIPKERIDANISRRIRKCISKKYNFSWKKFVNYSINDLILHLEKQFTPEMNWDNYGIYWHIDHIKPLAMFNYNSILDEEFRNAWMLSNLRPLEAKANMDKSDWWEISPGNLIKFVNYAIS